MRKGLVFELADRELNNGVLTMLCLDELELIGAVGQECVMTPVGPQLGLLTHESGASDDHPCGTERCLRDLRFAALGVLREGLPVFLRDRRDRCLHGRLLGDPDRIRPARRV